MSLLDKSFSELTEVERQAFAKMYKMEDLTTSKQIEIRNYIAYEENRLNIHALLALPMNKRTNFLRKRLLNGGSCL